MAPSPRKQSSTSSDTKPIELNDSNYMSTMKTEGLMFTDFWAEWCGPCRMMSPVIEELAKEYSGKVRFAKMNVDDNPVIPQQFGIMSIPTFVISDRGKVVDVLVGAMPKETVSQKLEMYLKGNSSGAYG